jgi:hypothetical protein
MTNIDDEWKQFMSQQRQGLANVVPLVKQAKPAEPEPTTCPYNDDIPVCEDLYISTNTKILYLNQMIDTYELFWKIPIIEYWKPEIGVVHKYTKIVSDSEEQLQKYHTHLESVKHYREKIIKQINIVHSKRPKFKDERKVMIGITKKELINTRKKQKNAFMNCFAIMIRFLYNGAFREIHVKIFNTGNMEIPGVLNMELLHIVKQIVLDTLQPHLTEPLFYVDKEGKSKSVLINSNFRCGFFIERDKMYSILRNKYNIDASYDPCSYPGVKCKFYFNNENGCNTLIQNGTIHSDDQNMTMTELGKNPKYTEITFTLFRTGSCLISGNCNEEILFYIFEFVKNILKEEYHNICSNKLTPLIKEKKIKLRKKTIEMTPEYYSTIYSDSLTQSTL